MSTKLRSSTRAQWGGHSCAHKKNTMILYIYIYHIIKKLLLLLFACASTRGCFCVSSINRYVKRENYGR